MGRHQPTRWYPGRGAAAPGIYSSFILYSTLEALRLRLRAAASEHAAAQTEAALVESMRGNAATLEVWAT